MGLCALSRKSDHHPTETFNWLIQPYREARVPRLPPRGFPVYTRCTVRHSFLVFVGAMGLVLLSSQLEIHAAAESGKVPTVSELVGSYTYAGDRAKDEAAIEAKVNAATAEMSRLVLKRAKPKLESSTRIPGQMSIKQQGSNLVFKMDDYVITTPDDGSSSKVTTPAGESADASFDAKTAALVQSVAKTGGVKSNAFAFNEAGQLLVHVRVTNDRLVGPVTYTLLYERSK